MGGYAHAEPGRGVGRMGARFEGGTRTEDCGHGLRVDSNRGNSGAMISLQREES